MKTSETFDMLISARTGDCDSLWETTRLFRTKWYVSVDSFGLSGKMTDHQNDCADFKFFISKQNKIKKIDADTHQNCVQSHPDPLWDCRKVGGWKTFLQWSSSRSAVPSRI